MNKVTTYVTRLPPGQLLGVCLLLVAVIGVIDYHTGAEMNVTMLYLAPIFLAAWGMGTNAAIVMSIISMTVWFVSVLYMHQTYSQPLLHVWDGVIQFAMFVLFGLVISKLKNALSHADERFATVLEGLNAAVFVSDANTGDLLYANEQFRATFPPASELPALPRAVHEGEVHDKTRGRWYLIHAQPVRWIDGRIARLQLATDITERRRAEALFRQQQEKMQMTARLVTIGEMATTLAHELNQPLAAISNYSMGCVRRLRSGTWDETELLDALEKGAAQAERASKVIQRVRAFVGRRTPNLVPCDINEVVSGVSSMIGVEARQNGANLKLELSEIVPYVHADPLLMEQVILNLARNAIEAMQETEPDDRELTIRSRPNGNNTVAVEVIDRGRGIDPQLEANLFTPFFSTKSHGMGLGLHICRSIVEAHGGHVWVSRNQGPGLTFHFSLKTVYA
ncbi:MAG TPA: ATP-binding protein [Burkholderiales bacterium]|nr:ATP-binding protein [Burkholderiales bacterium]